ncbi:MAG TPA: hypothetical protein VL793_03380, partial [Patescibacteria group bacterium]|nr:hypothetical protein [Patescibacteria group bacterium]
MRVLEAAKICRALLLGVLCLCLPVSQSRAAEELPEPTFALASTWWADLWNIWTPLGWKDHLYHFNVLWDGTILAKPDLNRRSHGQGVQLSLTPDFNDWKQRFAADTLRIDNHRVTQGWKDDTAPVLWSEWTNNGARLRCEVFAHVPGGSELLRGDEPIFLWMRVGIQEVIGAGKVQEFDLVIQSPHLTTEMTMWKNVHYHRDKARYPGLLRAEQATSSGGGMRIIDDAGKVRLGVAPGGFCELVAGGDNEPWHRLHVRLPAKRGATVDLLVPMVSEPASVFEPELALGHDAALHQTRRFWQKITKCDTVFNVPELPINDCLHQSVRFSHILTEKNPATGKYCKINGAWTYADLWATPGAMDLIMLLDSLGYHRNVERYLNIFLEEQGTVKPPGPSYGTAPGYFSTPALYKSIDWLSDNGAVLYTIAMHGLLTGDKEFVARSIGPILRSCEWIAASRRIQNHGGYEGVLPPAVATDNRRVIQGIWSIGWNYKGLCAAVRLLEQIQHPRADEFAAEAVAYREAFLKALHDKCAKAPRWLDSEGNSHVLVPTSLAGEEEVETKHAFYLDTGPLFLVFAGLLDADDPLMQDARSYFRQGPQRRNYRHDTDCWQTPVLEHEMSSCEPCYSWNIFHSWQLGDRARFLEGMYSVFAGAMSRQTRISCETRGGITGNVFAASLAAYLARLAVVDDQLRAGELHLLRLMPLAWLAPGGKGVFRSIPTEHGPLSLTTRLSTDSQKLMIEFEPRFR